MKYLLPTMMLSWFAVASNAGSAHAENVDLSTVPNRDTVQLTIYNSEDITLVRETRKISLKKGANPLQFSWAGTLIDPTSVELRFLTDPDKLEVLDTTFPHAKPQMLVWNVDSEINGEATIEITYFTSGISWSADYVLIADQDETKVGFEGFVRVYNQSGEEYEDARVRLVVGKINLVEKIAKLAGITVEKAKNLGRAKSEEYKRLAQREVMDAIEEQAEAAKEITKEGLSEYFIYTIEGTETVANGWSKRMRSLPPVDVPLKIQYRYREPEYGPQLVRMYLMRNNVESNLGTTPLPDGMVRVFRDNGRDGLSYLTAQQISYIPIGDQIELNLGPDPEVIFELIKLRFRRDNLWMHVNGTNIFRRVDVPDLQVEINSSVVGWNDHTIFTQRVRNYSNKPIELEVRRSFDGHVIFRSDLEASNHDFRTVQYTASVPAGERVDCFYEVVALLGRNKKQDNVTLEAAEITP